MVQRRFEERNALIAERRLAGERVPDLAAEYGVAESTIYGIIAGEGVVGERGKRRELRFCANEDCGAPIYRVHNGKYCCDACFRVAQRKPLATCGYAPCGKRLKRRYSKFCSNECYRAAERAFWKSARRECARPGCSTKVSREDRKYCSRACSAAHRTLKSFTGSRCARPGCSSFTTTRRQKYCSEECRRAVLRIPGGATDQKHERNKRRYGRKCLDCGVSLDDAALVRQRCEPCAHTRLRAKQREYGYKRREKRKEKRNGGRQAQAPSDATAEAAPPNGPFFGDGRCRISL